MSEPADTSTAAYRSIAMNDLEVRVHAAIQAYGFDGCISDQVRAAFPTLSYSSVTARFKSLEEKGMICRIGDTRKGESGRQQLVMRDAACVKRGKPVVRFKTKNPFLSGMMHAARVIVKAESDFKGTAGAIALKLAILKVARK